MITISVCMIVKNEEKILARCLDCVKTLADEIIIVDTGSSDSTKDIAAKYTNKIYDFKWIDDFSAARNYSLDKATMDYIYIADADEVIDDENIARFETLKKGLLPEIDVVQMKITNQLAFNTVYNFDTEYRPKLFKRLRPFRFQDPVHETLILSPCIFDSDVEIRHMPLSNHASRDIDVMLKATRSGKGLSSKLIDLYARELYIAGTDEDFLNAGDYFHSVLADPSSTGDDITAAECVAAKCAVLCGDTNSLLKISLKNISGDQSSEVLCQLGDYFSESGDFSEALIWYQAAAGSQSRLNLHYSGDIPLKLMADCYEALGDARAAQGMREAAQSWIPPENN